MEPDSPLPHSQVPATCPYPEPDLSSPSPPHPVSWRSIVILSSHLYLGLPSGLFHSGFPTKTLYTPLPHTYYLPRPSHSPWFYHPNNTGWGVQSLSSSLCSALPRYLVPPRPKYSPQHPILRHPQSKFLPQCERPTFTPIHNNGQN